MYPKMRLRRYTPMTSIKQQSTNKQIIMEVVGTVLSISLLIVAILLYKNANGLLEAKKEEFRRVAGMTWEEYEREEKRKKKMARKAKRANKVA